MRMDIIHKEESFKIVGALLEVHNELGPGFLEAVYHEALMIEFERRGIPFEHEKELEIFYKDIKLNKHYYADFVCYDKIIIEVKALSQLASNHDAQMLNYLKAARFKLGILVNFGENKLKYKRLVF